ncbi:DUF3079 domain-containing protein [Comamonas odontotermitis]|uniref:DUF3079 domain-containing protein n=1 Tax=Comamonas odontotermitis TaxID=379895 RepID=UPI0037530D1F
MQLQGHSHELSLPVGGATPSGTPLMIYVKFLCHAVTHSGIVHLLAFMAKRFPNNPVRPENVFTISTQPRWSAIGMSSKRWDAACTGVQATAMACGNGSERSQHPAELFGPDWAEWDPLTLSDDTAADARPDPSQTTDSA